MAATRLLLALMLGVFLSGCMHHHQEGEHATHQKMLEQPPSYTRSMASYQVPEATLVDQDGKRVNLAQLLTTSEPYALNFIFTTCTTVCPILSASFTQLQQELGADAEGLQMFSVSIDPEYDTPATLKEYAQRYQADRNWHFLTGEVETVIGVQKAFAGYVSDKMNHRPFTLFKVPGEKQWLRIEGLASGTDLAEEYRRLSGR